MLDRKRVQNLSNDLDRVLKEFAEKNGLSVQTGSIRFSSTDFTVKVKIFDTESGDVEQVEFEKYCSAFNLIKSDYRRPFEHNGKTFKLTGFKPRSPKFPILATNSNGEQYKFQESILIKLK